MYESTLLYSIAFGAFFGLLALRRPAYLLVHVLHLSLHSCRRLHASLGTLAVVLAMLHAIIAGATTGKLNLQTPKDTFALVSIVLLCTQFIPLLLRNVRYEAALRLHQILALALPYALWRHIRSGTLFPSLYIFLGGTLFLFSAIISLGNVLYRNSSGLSLAQISLVNGTTQIRLRLSRPLKVRAGQYINLWVPSVSLWAFSQTHPFVVTSWSQKPQEHLDLFIEPRRGFTKDLLRLAEHGPTTSMAWFSGPHGKPLPISRYENVVMLATESGIAAHLPYLKKLAHDQRSHEIPVRRVHLIWQMERRDGGIAAQKLLTEALAEDKLSGQHNLRMSIHITGESIEEVDFGSRATVYQGPIPLADILCSERRQRRRGISMCGSMRDTLVEVMRRNRYRGMDVRYAEYQP
ncbi:Ferric/cupric reductase transmembrane component 2 [Beauveria bassiana]|nr:Ferric/cupric reductase transmembrane component 2 [Beauveria bassiana]